MYSLYSMYSMYSMYPMYSVYEMSSWHKSAGLPLDADVRQLWLADEWKSVDARAVAQSGCRYVAAVLVYYRTSRASRRG